MKIRTLSVAVDAHDTNLGSFAHSIDCAIDTACDNLESVGNVVLGISPVGVRTTEIQYGDGHRDTTSTESGVVAVITYRMAEEPTEQE